MIGWHVPEYQPGLPWWPLVVVLVALVIINVINNRVAPQSHYLLWAFAGSVVLIAIGLLDGNSWTDMGLGWSFFLSGFIWAGISIGLVTAFYVVGSVFRRTRQAFKDESIGSLSAGRLAFQALVEVRVRDITLPLHDVVTVAANVTPRELQTLCVDTGYSRFPVVEDGRMVGYVHVKDLVSLPARKLDEPLRPSYIRDFPEVRDTDTLSHVLATMQRRGVHMVQVNADGRQHGVAMLEDVLERIVGDVVA